MNATVHHLRFAYREISASLRHDLEHRAYLSAGIDVSLLVVGLPLVTLVALPGVAVDTVVGRLRRPAVLRAPTELDPRPLQRRS